MIHGQDAIILSKEDAKKLMMALTMLTREQIMELHKHGQYDIVDEFRKTIDKHEEG